MIKNLSVINSYLLFLYAEWEKWKPSCKFGEKESELEESTAITGDAGVRGSYLEENEGTL